MTLYYAPGGGLGHTTRARRVLEALGIRDGVVIGSSNLPLELEGDVEAHRAWLQSRMADHLIVDTFPAGIQGELAGIDVPHVDHVARLLRWDEYRRSIPEEGPQFRTTYAVEELTPAHEGYLRERSEFFTPLRVPSPAEAGEGARRADEGADHWLIVHSGPPSEVLELVAYAETLRELERADAEIRVATRCEVELPGCTRIESATYATAAKIITAAGFNVMLETEPYRDRHHVIPFPRRFDDQFLRAARRRNTTARIG